MEMAWNASTFAPTFATTADRTRKGRLRQRRQPGWSREHQTRQQPQEDPVDGSFIDNATVDQLVDALNDLESLAELLTRKSEQDRNRQYQDGVREELKARGVTLA